VKFFIQVGAALALVCSALAQTNEIARIQNLDVTENNHGVKIELILTASVTPHVTLTSKPDRLTIDLPGTVPGDRSPSIAFNKNGVRTIRTEATTAAATPFTRIIIGLSKPLAYQVATDQNKITLILLPADSAKTRSGPVPAASVPLFSRIGRRPEELPQSHEPEVQNSKIPTPSPQPPLNFPEEQPSTASAQTQPGPATAGTAAQSVGESTPTGNESVSAEGIAPQQANPDVRVAFRVKYVAEGVAYLDGGRNDGLAEGMKLEVKEIDPSEKSTSKIADVQPIAELQVASAALSSTVSEIRNPTRPLKAGDWAYLSSEDTQALIAQRSLSATRKYPVVVAFSEGDTLDDEARVVVPRPPLPEINRARGRIGFDYSGVSSHDFGGGLSSNVGLLLRTDITRINGTYWNLNGFWRGRITNRSHGGQETLQDLINRTYTIGLTYDNPNSKWVAGFGRLYLPWATSLDTIDGGYFGRRLAQGVTAGIFAGSTPDPTSWSYNSNRRIGGAFVNFEGGSFDNVRYTSTSGMGLGMLQWNIDRPFVFFENGIFYKRYLSIYHSLQADSPSGNPEVAAPGPGISRSFLTVRVQPTSRVEFDLNHTYFRDIPTYEAKLIDTGLLDKYLFQGFSGGVRVKVVKDIWAYTLLGRSNRSGDAKASWNQLYGVTVGRMPWIGMRTDVHYSKFDSSFGSGSYESVSLSRNFNDALRWEVLGGRQSFASPTVKDISHFVTGNFEASLGPHYFVQSGYTWNRGSGQNYDQWLFTFGYRFDSRSRGR
jgi:hypothetical protein